MPGEIIFVSKKSMIGSGRSLNEDRMEKTRKKFVDVRSASYGNASGTSGISGMI